MIKNLLIVVMLAFMIYTFVAVDIASKTEIARTTIAIPQKAIEVIGNIAGQISQARDNFNSGGN